MSVDVEKFEHEHSQMVLDWQSQKIGLQELSRRTVALSVALHRAVLADTAAPPDPKPPECDAPAEPKRTTKNFAEFIEWQAESDPELRDALNSAKRDFDEMEDAITARVDAATAAIAQERDAADSEIVLLTKLLEIADTNKADLRQQLAVAEANLKEVKSDRDHAIGYLTRLFAAYAPQCAPFGDLQGLISQVDSYVCGLKQQLAEHDRRVAEKDNPLASECAADADAALASAAYAAVIADRDAEIERLRVELHDAVKKEMITAGENTRLKANLAEARKPVENEEIHEVTMKRSAVFPDSPIVLMSYVDRFLSRERAARLEAERREDELREFVRTKRVMLHEISRRDFFTVSRECVVTDTELDKLLTAYRASKPEAAGGAR